MNNEKEYHIKYASKHLNYVFPEIDSMPQVKCYILAQIIVFHEKKRINFTYG